MCCELSSPTGVPLKVIDTPPAPPPLWPALTTSIVPASIVTPASVIVVAVRVQSLAVPLATAVMLKPPPPVPEPEPSEPEPLPPEPDPDPITPPTPSKDSVTQLMLVRLATAPWLTPATVKAGRAEHCTQT